MQRVADNIVSLGLCYSYTNKNKELEVFMEGNEDDEIDIDTLLKVIEDGKLKIRYSNFMILRKFIERMF
jgi:hypothetical protein